MKYKTLGILPACRQAGESGIIDGIKFSTIPKFHYSNRIARN
jgi:hypothetical protein